MKEEELVQNRTKSRRVIFTILFCMAVSFICITINSENSFLYKIQYCDDMQCFMTTARCMLRGDVLYRDVYEHKGLYLYVLYMLGYQISAHSFIGIYLIELILFAVFIYFCVQTLRLFSEKDLFNLPSVALIAVKTTSVYAFRGGGEAEELVLPLLTGAVYIVIKQYRRLTCGELHSSRKEIAADGFIVGICFAIVFWMKYTLTGAFVGLALTVVIIGIKRKDLHYIVCNVTGFLTGAIAGSLPVFLYFAANHALGDLWDVYFYTLIFRYGSKDGNILFKFWQQFLKMQKYYVILPLFLLAFASVDGKNEKIGTNSKERMTVCKMDSEVRLIGILVIVFSVIGNVVGKVQSYTYEVQHAFSVLGVAAFFCIARQIVKRGQIVSEKLRNCNNVEKTVYDRFSLTLYLSTVKLKNEWEMKYKYRFRQRTVVMLCGFFLVLYYAVMVYIPSPFRMFMKYDYEDYPICRMSAYMLEHSKEPKILYLNCSDHGLFNLTETYPMGRYFGCYALYTPEELGYYENYLETKEADFVLTVNEEYDLTDYGYTEVMKDERVPFLIEGQYISFYFYAREQ